MVKVFIVDDSLVFVNELTLTVPWKRLGCEVVGSATEADTAERGIREKKPDLVITDISMPGRDGLQLIEALEDMPRLEFILVSAYSRFEYALKAIKLNTTDYFVKPFDDDEFYGAIEKAAKRIAARPQNSADEKLCLSAPELPQGQNYTLEDALRYVDEHYGDDLSAASVARELFVSESCLRKQFRRELNTSFVEYLCYVRIRKAMLLFKTTDMKIYEVSEQTGFIDPKYFATTFRKYTGITPSQYKNTVKG